ncbi:MAG: AbrB/MazE/SpoVT family DNA-binding domain-containing protein [Clostridiales bacterium]|nr:AbrB/MazE/SpoVT family DNA-binding domain-containing protein [Clostridiales bacterium]
MKGPDGKYVFGTAKVGEKGQIVIPKDAREIYGIKPGELVLLLGDDKGLAIIKNDLFMKFAQHVMSAQPTVEEEE